MTDFDTERMLLDFRTSSFPERRKLAAEYDTLVARLAKAEHVLKEISMFGRDNIEYGDTCAEMAEAYFSPTALGSPTEPAKYSPNEHAQRCNNCGRSWLDHKPPEELCPVNKALAEYGPAWAEARRKQGYVDCSDEIEQQLTGSAAAVNTKHEFHKGTGQHGCNVCGFERSDWRHNTASASAQES